MKTYAPGATIGVVGGGQLGRMFALVARRMGYRVHNFDPVAGGPAGQVCDREFTASFDDEKALRQFAASVDVITYEFENIPVASLNAMAQNAPLYPSPEILRIAQNRRREKEYLDANGFGVVPFRFINSLTDLQAAMAQLNAPCVLKTADFGYDGKGQRKLKPGDDLEAVWCQHGGAPGVLEKWIDCEAELSVLIARNGKGSVRCFPVPLNCHKDHILATSDVPGPWEQAMEDQALQMAEAIAAKMGLVGIMAVEMFLTNRGELYVNELAPRPHNSGHYTIDACITSQFEQQLRAVCGLPLGEPTLLAPARMRNLLGDLWSGGEPDWPKLLDLPGLHLHLYGKAEARPGRKMGHYTVVANSTDEVRRVDGLAQQYLR
jgi:5-(carboxyamino)imidazole ribonucleotide synthase